MDPAFTILDREDAADLMNLVRTELRLHESAERFPLKGTCLAIYSAAVNTREVARPACWPTTSRGAALGARAARALRRLRGGEAAPGRARLRRPAALLGAADGRARAGRKTCGSRFDHVLVDEYQDTNRLQATILLALKPDGRGLTVVGDDAQAIYAFRGATVRNILDFPAQFTPPARIVTLARNYRSTQPILDAANAVIGLAAERFTKDLFSDRASHREAAPGDGGRRSDTGALRRRRRCSSSARPAIALKQQAVLFRAVEPQRRAGTGAGPSQHPVRQVRRTEVPRSGAREGRARRAAPGRRTRATASPASACCNCCPARARRLRRACSMRWRAAIRARRSPPSSRRTPRTEEWTAFAPRLGSCDNSHPAGRRTLEHVCGWYQPHLERLHDDADVRRADLRQLEAHRSRLPLARTLPHRADARSARRHQRRGRRAAEGRGLPDPVDDPLGQGPGVAGGDVLNAVDGCIPSDLSTGTTAELEEERRLLYVAMTRAKDHLHARGAAAVLCAPAGRRRRPPRLRVKDAVHSGEAGRTVREGQLAGSGERVGAGRAGGAGGGSCGTDAGNMEVGARRVQAIGSAVTFPANWSDASAERRFDLSVVAALIADFTVPVAVDRSRDGRRSHTARTSATAADRQPVPRSSPDQLEQRSAAR